MVRWICGMLAATCCSATSGAGISFQPPSFVSGLAFVSDVLLADVDADGDPDLITLRAFQSEVRVYLNDGFGAFGAPASFGSLAGPTPESQRLAAADMDCDGDIDLCVADTTRVVVLPNNGSGAFGSESFLPMDAVLKKLALSDMDADGDMDIVAISSSAVAVFLNSGSGTSAVRSDYAVTYNASALDLGDVDSDGDTDVVVGYGDGAGLVMEVLKNQGNGTLSAPTSGVAFGNCAAIDLCDLDGDGDLDLALSNQTLTRHYRNDGTGAFSVAGLVVDKVSPSLRCGDITSDDLPDVVSVQLTSIRISAQDGLGGFASTTYPTGGMGVVDLEVGDLNADGLLDVVAADYQGEQAIVMLQSGPVSGAAGAIEVPPVVVSALAHTYDEGNPRRGGGRDTFIYDQVLFNGSEGSFSNMGFFAAAREGMEVVVRLEAPSGQRFELMPPSGFGATTDLALSATWSLGTLPGVVVAVNTQGTATWEGLEGVAPTATSRQNGVSCNGRKMRIIRTFSASQACSFTALELRFPVTSAPPGSLQRFAAVATGFFGSETQGDPELPDQVVLTLAVIPPPQCAGDANGDNSVDGADLSVLLGQFGQSVTPGTGADLNGDGIVNGADLSVLLGQFGATC